MTTASCIHFLANSITQFLINENNSTVYVHHIFFAHSSVGRHLGHIHIFLLIFILYFTFIFIIIILTYSYFFVVLTLRITFKV